MIYEISFLIIGGANLGLERSWKFVENLIKKYPYASWRRVVNKKKGTGKYIVFVN